MRNLVGESMLSRVVCPDTTLSPNMDKRHFQPTRTNGTHRRFHRVDEQSFLINIEGNATKARGKQVHVQR